MKSLPTWFWVTLSALFGLKLFLVSDLPVHLVFAPHDDSLYIARALFLLDGQGLGPYDARTLAKLPGISIWIAGLRALGLPYMISMNFFYAGAGLYALLALRRCGVNTLVLVAIWALYLFSPITTSLEWLRILREALSSALLVLLFGAASYILISIRDGKRYWPHLVVFSAALAFSMLVREEDKLLWGLLVFFSTAAFLDGIARGQKVSWSLRVAAPLLLTPAFVAMAFNVTLRHEITAHYGLPILHDYSEGEYPRLLAAIRSIDSKKENRLVMVTQEALGQLHAVVPEFSPVIDNLPPPGPSSLSCRLQGVCSEWSNGWMPFFIKDAAFSAGLTPDLVTAQKYFKGVREHIEEACRNGRLQCTPRGESIMPPFELHMTRALVTELARLFDMILNPLPSGLGTPSIDPNINPYLRRLSQAVTMDATDINIAMNPDAASNPIYINETANQLRLAILKPHSLIVSILLMFSLAALLYCWTAEAAHPPSVLLWITTLFFFYSALRLLALAYIATFLGPFDPRIIFSSYTAALIFFPVAIAEAIRIRKLSLRRNSVPQPEG